MYEKKYVVIGARIAYFRRLKCLTQEGLALKCGLSRGRISLIERGRSHFKMDTLIDIAEALSVSLGQIIAEKDF